MKAHEEFSLKGSRFICDNLTFCDSLALQYVLDAAQRIIDNFLDSGMIASVRIV